MHSQQEIGISHISHWIVLDIIMEIKFLNAELIDVLNIEDFASRKEYGRERGLMPSPTEAQTRLVDKISQKINARAPSRAAKEDDEESLIFDLKSKPRVHLFDAPILKRCK